MIKKQDKKGVFPFIALGIFIAIIIGALAFLFSDSMRYILIGIALFVGFFFVLGQAMTSKITKPKLAILGIILVVAIGFVIFGNVQQSFLGVSEFKTDDGKGYWLISGVADSIGDSATFLQRLPLEGTLPNGTKVKPTQPLKLSISKGEQKCEYKLIKKTPKIYTGIFKKETITYYELESHQRVINVVFSDDRGNSQEVDGTTNQVLYFYDSDEDGGLATIKTVKSTQGKRDCPNNDNVVVMKSNENPSALEFSKPIVYLDKTDFQNFLEEYGSLFSAGRFFEEDVNELDSFRLAFSNGQITLTSTKLTGTGIDLGDVIFTITADREYFDSVMITPAKPTDAYIDEVFYPKRILQNSDSSLKVLIKNRGDKGIVNIKLNSNSFSFGTSAQDITLDEETTFTTTIKAQKEVLDNAEINIKVCGTSQIGKSNCDEENIFIDIEKEEVGEDEIIDPCGNTICDEFENELTCPQDCAKDSKGGVTGKIECSWYQESYIREKEDCGVLSWRKVTPFVDCKKYIESGCKVAGWVYLVSLGTIILILGTLIIVLFVVTKPKSKKRKKRR